jgi:iron-sulfur cluster assembly protein
MALDESKDSDEVFEFGNQPYVIDKALLTEASPVTVDYNEMGYKIDTTMVMPESACGGCGSSGTC